MHVFLLLPLALVLISSTTAQESTLNHTIVWLLRDDNVTTDIANEAKVSGKLTIAPRHMTAGLDDFNIVLPSVPRELVTYLPKWSRDTHLFGIATGPNTIELSRLCTDSVEGGLDGTGHTDIYETKNGYSLWRTYHRWWNPDLYHKEDELGPYQTVSTTLDIEISNFSVDETAMSIEESLQHLDTPSNTTIKASLYLKVIIWINPTFEQRRAGLIPARIVVQDYVHLDVVVVPHPDEAEDYPFDITFKRQLCLQPVRFKLDERTCVRYVDKEYKYSRRSWYVRRYGWRWYRYVRYYYYTKYYKTYKRECVKYENSTMTGTGFDSARAVASAEWNKVNIELTWKPMKTIDTKSRYDLFVTAGRTDTSYWETRVMDNVNDDDCVEVYFIKEFDPKEAHGGGAVWNPGTASAKVVVADSHLQCNQPTFLAHLIGHALGLKHPGNDSDGYKAGSPGTVMCESVDDTQSPSRNSVENGLNVNNPLVTWSVDFAPGGTPDCGAGLDGCGTCEEHIDNTPCHNTTHSP